MSDRWDRVGVLFDRALARPAAERASWVRASGEPEEVQKEVLSLLDAHESAGRFLERPAIEDEPVETQASERASHSTPPLEPDPVPQGTLVGPYRIARVIGQGGMGIVYEAEDTRLHRRVALKSLPKRLAGNERLRLRLRQEARAAAAMTHPGIATVYALEEFDEGVFIASEYVEGHTLRSELERGPMPLDRAVTTARDIALALEAAHLRGIVHRDLKPENVLRTVGGAVKLLDFGLAQLEAGAQELASWTRLTEPGLIAGTPPYMSPEQLLGRQTDARTDLFSLGVMLYEMACGRHPFGGGSLPSTIARILAAEPERPAERLAGPGALWAVIDRCLKKDPAERFASTSEVVHSLDALVSDLPPAAGKPLRPSDTQYSEPGTRSSALWWWQFHQLAAAVLYWFMVWPAWHVHRWVGSGGLIFFALTLASVIVAANLRLHLWFSSRIYPDELADRRADIGAWIRWADWAFAATLAGGGLSLGEGRAGWAALLFAFAVGNAVAFLIIEPTTARAAFGGARKDRSP